MHKKYFSKKDILKMTLLENRDSELDEEIKHGPA
jgi:hypothetical protein